MNAKRWFSPAVFALILLAAAGRPVLAVEAHQHGDGAGSAPKLQLNAGKKWATDQILRQSMDEINRAMQNAIPRIHKNRFANSDYDALSALVNQKVAYAIDHCQLEPEADAMLHLVIAELMAGAQTMAGQSAVPRHDGAVRVQQALKSYGRYFQHPGWKSN